MIYTAVSFLGCFLGYITARFTKEELKSGKNYFNILELIIMFILLVILIYYSFDLSLFLIGILLGLILRFEYFYFGAAIASSFNLNLSFLSSALVFVYGLPYGSLIYYYKKVKYLVYSLIFFSLPMLNYFFNYNLLSISAGGLLSLFIIKIKNLR